jgi:hypothetical protein
MCFRWWPLAAALLLASTAQAQTECTSLPVYSRCELRFELNDAERKAHPNPYLTATLNVEFRSPRHRTQLMPAFWNGEGRLIVRFAPMDAGDWEYKVSSNIRRFEGKEGKFTATEAQARGFVIPANGHHWRYTEGQAAHLWMGDTRLDLASVEDAAFREYVESRAAAQFTHVRMRVSGNWRDTNTPDLAFYQKLDERMALLNSKGLTPDAIVQPVGTSAAERDRYLRYLIARYAAFDMTWQVLESFESVVDGREIAKEMGLYLKNNDPYRHPRTTHALVTSSPLTPDGWMDHITYGSTDEALGAIEHQVFPLPGVNTGLAQTSPAEFRKRLWTAFTSGQYPGAAGALDAASLKAMSVWYGLAKGTRHWELEPYFDLDGGRAIALPDVEYIVYVEKPSGPIEVRMEKHEYDVKWIDPATGETVPLKSFKSDKFTGEAPSRDHDWVLHLSREGHKEGMLRSWKFESRPFLMQEVESAPTKVPYAIEEPKSDELSLSKPPAYSAKLKRETRGTRSMLYLWTGDMPIEGHGFRVIGTGATGTWNLKWNAFNPSGVMNVRLYGMNANGKVYAVDKIFRVVP